MTDDQPTAQPDAPKTTRPRRSVAPGQRDHGELSQHQAGPDAQRHAEDVVALLTAERDDAEKRRDRAEQDRIRAVGEVEKWGTAVEQYDAMLRALANAQNPNGRRR